MKTIDYGKRKTDRQTYIHVQEEESIYIYRQQHTQIIHKYTSHTVYTNLTFITYHKQTNKQRIRNTEIENQSKNIHRLINYKCRCKSNYEVSKTIIKTLKQMKRLLRG